MKNKIITIFVIVTFISKVVFPQDAISLKDICKGSCSSYPFGTTKLSKGRYLFGAQDTQLNVSLCSGAWGHAPGHP